VADASKFGLFTPILFMMPGAGAWEADARMEELAAVAKAADRLGYGFLACGEHVLMSKDQAEARGARYFDPLATFGYLAALTERIRFATYVLVLGYSHPLEIAKRYGTLDVVTGGRLTLGVGVGSLKPEFDALGLGGAAFTERGARGDDALAALRAALGRREVEYHGRYYDFEGLVIDPHATRTDVPIWVGGRSERSLRRALAFGDGWAPFGPTDQLQAMLERTAETPSWQDRRRPFEIVLRSDEFRVDAVDQPGSTAAGLRRLFDAGATQVVLNIQSRSCAHYIEQLEALAALDV
jgi:probable F420-dependent oxidoreductase